MDDNDKDLIVEQSVANIRSVITELDMLIDEEYDKTRMEELQELKHQLLAVLKSLTSCPPEHKSEK